MEIKINNFSKVYNSKKVIGDFSHEFIPNEVYMLLGGNGSGKSTLLKCISTLLLPDSGEIYFDGERISKRKDLFNYRKQVSLLLDPDKSLYSELTILQNVKFFLGINDIRYAERKKEIFELLERFELMEHMNKQVKHLSKGMKQKTALIIAFVKNPKVLLLDEPFEGLDDKGIATVKDLLEKYSKNAIVIITSPSEVDSVATKIIHMSTGVKND